ncbi:glycosyltransferase family 4 protein [Haladaptatus caseinilyticus]|uniref:glycosyltransferase family 4 protein n=1 Tax=Haladaptatus caseinilyticus TaxID=2993314 RepID=UPI00224A74BF|nr:glycosyltransferase family 4 protein [Haladaptatus caseinilyticus]
MKILLITREFPPHVLGGISYALAQICDELLRDHDVEVITGTCREASDRPIHEISRDFTLHTVDFGSIEGNHIRFPYALKTFLADFDIERFDIAYTHTPLPYGLKIPLITHYHDSKRKSGEYVMKEYSTFKKILDKIVEPTRRFVDQRSLDVSDHYIFNSKICRDAWQEYYKFSSPSNIVYNGVDSGEFFPEEGQEDYVLFIGDNERKGIDDVRRFSSETQRRVIIVGDPNHSSQYFETLSDISQEELRSLYSKAYATIHPANFEAFGNIILESLACGTPVVVSSRCGASELLNESTGVVSNDLTKGVEEVSSCDTASCRKLAEKYSWKAAIENLNEIFIKY